ncbi:MAG: AAA family ATPase [Hydrogeniiclostridium sp.]
MLQSVITIARQYGSGGRTIGKKLAESLNIPFYDKELIAMAAKKSGLSQEVFEKADEKATSSLLYSLVMGTYNFGSHFSTVSDMPINDRLFMIQSDIIQHAALEGSCVIVGRCADYVLREHPHCFHVFIRAEHDDRVKRIVEEYGDPAAKADDLLQKKDKQRANYYNFYSNKKWADMNNYDLVVNSSLFGIDGSVDVIKAALEIAEKK